MNESQNTPVVYDYEGNSITFFRGKNVMVNATEMAKKFDKKPIRWLQNQQTQDFLAEYSKVTNRTLVDLVRVIKGGSNPGTWMYEDIALEFARWLSPKFAIWCNDRIKELLTTGVTTLSDDDAMILHSIQVLQKRVADSKQQIAALSSQNKQLAFSNQQKDTQILSLTSEVETMKPKADYYDLILNSKNTVTTTQVAQDYGFTAIAFNRLLMQMRIQHKVGTQWILYQPYLSSGYVTSKPIDIVRSNGAQDVIYNTVWTQKGRIFLYNTLKSSGILPLIEK